MWIVAIVRGIVDALLAFIGKPRADVVARDGEAAPRGLRESVAARLRERKQSRGADPSDSLGGGDAE